MVGEAVPEQAAAWFEGDSHVAVYLYIGVADLPIAASKVRHGPFSVGAGHDVETAVFDRGRVESDPHADHCGIEGDIKIGAVLVPGFFTADMGRFEQRHLLEYGGSVVHESFE